MSNSGVTGKQLINNNIHWPPASFNSTTAMGGETKDTMASSKEYPKLAARPVGKKVRA